MFPWILTPDSLLVVLVVGIVGGFALGFGWTLGSRLAYRIFG